MVLNYPFNVQSYLEITLRSVFDNMSEDEMSDCLVVVFVAETDLTYVHSIAKEVLFIIIKTLSSGI